MMWLLRAGLVVVFLGALSANCGADDYLPRNTQPAGEEPPSSEEAARLITVPKGFQVRLFAGDPDVRQPVAMALDDRGRLFVGESYSYHEWKKTGEDRILIFEDLDNDGRFDTRKVFVSGIDHLSGMTVGWGGVWVCSAPNLLFYPDADRDDVPDGEPEVILDGWTTEAGHNFFNGLTWGPDGWLYGRHGITKSSLVGRPGTPEKERIGLDCSIWRYHPVTRKFEVVCRGTTNPWGMDWNEKGDLFFTNNVNGHLWHAIPGAFYPRMGERQDPHAAFVYDRIGMCCDHLHHAGSHTDWTKTRDGKGVHGPLGGGHSHCGAMIYQGGKWPQRYEGRIFMNNIHGRRINVDRLDETGVTYAGRHEEDFLFANQPWFRGIDLLCGPDGDVYLSDWVDLGECHDNDGVHRTSGRIYKIIHGEPSPPMKKDLWEMTDEELMALGRHKNQWQVRQSTLLLRQRVAAGELNPGRLDEHLASITFKEESPISPRALRIAASELNQLPTEERWKAAEKLLRECPPHEEVTDLLIYFAIKDAAAKVPDRSLELLRAAADQHRIFSKNLAQNLAENGVFAPLLTLLGDSGGPQEPTASILHGMAAGLRGRKPAAAPENWDRVFSACWQSPELRHSALAVNLVFDEARSRMILEKMLHESRETGEPAAALALLHDFPDSELAGKAFFLVKDPDLSSAALRVLGASRDRKVAENLIAVFNELPGLSKPLAVNVLSGKKEFARLLLEAVRKGSVPREAVTAYHATQISTFKDAPLNDLLGEVWGRTGSTSSEKRAEIKKWQDQLLPDVLAQANTENGAAKFQQLCSGCHRLHGTGGVLGPDLTGANRSDLFYLLENIIDPSATLPADFQMTVITRKDGRITAGTVKGENEYSVTLENLNGSEVLQKDEIEKRETLKQSLMPEGLLSALSEEEVRDLIAFLQK